jgi:hypothetical protein
MLLQCRRQVDRAEAQAFADENGLSYVEASAKNADGVDEAFMSTCEKVYDNMKNGVFSRRNTTRTDGGGEVSAVDVDSCLLLEAPCGTCLPAAHGGWAPVVSHLAILQSRLMF